MTINCKGMLIDLNTPKIMGILNLTPDSFYDGGKFKNSDSILRQVELMLKEGATFIDLGAYSSRPGAHHVSEEEELHRLLPTISVILKEFPGCLLSIDTFRAKVAHKSLQLGAALINDISASNLDKNMFDIVAQYQVPYIMMHMKGTPQNMKELSDYDDMIKDILYYFSERVVLARKKKINDIIIDPGFGFAKNTAQNFQLLAHFNLFKTFELPLLAGLSRKSMIYKTLKSSASEALNGTTALHMIALQNGANILRAHDVKEATECIALHHEIQANRISI
ncbi:dihydropteroate synthase [Croceitalea rosinachiae]|uniref:Dihydropteroate synthase n=1 Tax=Croceitalea rosinachiae TaxID=3075596 RepID=A0ABU3AD58_9FLAO|nr:dihydropteroate synthase [Croceitalea sp. F388]MDT0608111.1 dihydropteroate synthase [Croceitalea sp. F388]